MVGTSILFNALPEFGGFFAALNKLEAGLNRFLGPIDEIRNASRDRDRSMGSEFGFSLKLTVSAKFWRWQITRRVLCQTGEIRLRFFPILWSSLRNRNLSLITKAVHGPAFIFIPQKILFRGPRNLVPRHIEDLC